MRVILASASPRRQELLAQIGIGFEVRVSHVEERSHAVTSGQMVEELSAQKAQAVLQMILEEAGEAPGRESLLVIGADTVVSVKGQVLGKPGDGAEAVKMLELLAGGTHQVCTGVTLLYCGEDGSVAQKVFHETTRVEFYPMSKA